MKILEIIKNIFKNPLFFVVLYTLAIPIFALFYYYLTELSQLEFTDSLYFSVVTITTLGYGDITPQVGMTKFLASTESILGIVLVGLFLNALSHTISYRATKKEQEAQKEKELILAKNRFLSFNRLVEQKIDRYYKYIIIITNGQNSEEVLEINKDFKFNILQYIYEPSFMLTDNLFKPVIDFYYESQKELLKTLEDLVALGYLENWHDFEKICLDFVVELKNYDFSDFILNQKNTTLGENKYTDAISKIIKEYEDEVKIQESNMITPYIYLYNQLKQSIEFIENYNNFINKMNI